MNRFIIPQWVKDLDFEYEDYTQLPAEFLANVKKGLVRFSEPNPEVSIIIPAWNEEKSIVKTLASFSELTLPFRTELIVVNNNSTDRTQEILDYFGVTSYFQPIQGISITRQLGLEKAKGNIILSADADSLYPPQWGTNFAQLLQNPTISVVYGRYSFIPSTGSRIWLAVHEILAETIFYLRRGKKDFLNVMGFNFAYRRDEAFAVGGFSRIQMKWEDGMMAKRLQDQFGKIALVATSDSRPWTSDRRLMADGGLFKAFVRRLKKEFKFLHELLPTSNYDPATAKKIVNV